ncbi:MAG: glycosyltransferase family 4 protein [Cyclobacteriaceae bacterium]|nr:glycosyltransferase family 4 protein [Cyclobacteriaceae bacterium]
MKIAIVLNTSWNIHNFRMGLIHTLLKQGHEIVAIAPEDEFSIKIKEAGCSFERITMDSRGANPIKDFGLTIELFRIYRRIRPDIILHFTVKPNIYGTFAARLLNIPSINNVCGLGTVFLNKGLISVIAKIMYKMAFRYPNKVLFQNEDDLDLFIREKLIKLDKTDRVPGSGINLEKFTPRKNEKNEKFIFLMIARLIYDKGIVEYINAIRKLKTKGIDAKFQILGAIDEEHKRGIPASLVHTWVGEELIDYHPKVSDVRDYIRDADCIVLPSYREGTPRSLLEAAGMAKPIVTTNVAGCNSVVIDNTNGFLCKLKDVDDLAEKMEKMVDLAEADRERMGNNGRKIVEQYFDENIVIDKYMNLIAQYDKKISA